MNTDRLKSENYQACESWALRYGRRDGEARWRVPIDAVRSALFDLPLFDGTAPPAPFPYPMPLEGSPLAVYAVWEQWDCESGSRSALQKNLESTAEWNDAVAAIRAETEKQRRIRDIASQLQTPQAQ